MKDIKVTLKEAREAIKNKDFALAMKLSKSILKEDKANYMALVFLGLSLQEIGPKDQAPKAFQKAIEVNESNPLAWNGLVNYYEKIDLPENKSEVIRAYIGAARFETVEKKLLEYTDKLEHLFEQEHSLEICTAMYDISQNENCTSSTKCSILEKVSKILTNQQKNMTPELCDLYEKCLVNLLKIPDSSNLTNYSNYLTLLSKQSRYNDVLNVCEEMCSMFENNPVALNWFCGIFNQLYVEENPIIEKVIEKVPGYFEKLSEVQPNASTTLFTKSILCLDANRILEARDNLEEVIKQCPGLIHAMVLLVSVNLRLNLWEEARQLHYKLEKLLNNYSNDVLKKKQKVFELDILSRSNNKEDWSKALVMNSEIKENDIKSSCLIPVIRANISLENYQECKELLRDLETKNRTHFKLYNAKILRKQGKLKEALKMLENDPEDDCEIWTEIGSLYWELQDYDKSLIPFLKAAKCDPNNYLCFINLGNFYNKSGDLDKARRCYEKAFKINSRTADIGTELCQIYRKLKNWEANLNLLNNLTNGTINKTNMWAFLQLGLHYLEQQDYDKAIENLRYVIRIDTDNVHCWESLADAYFDRGSYTSALRCYERAMELSDNALYPFLQTAHIKKILGEYAEAKADFEEILSRKGEYVPALQGLGQTCMCLARQCYSQQRLGTARDYAQLALEQLAKVIHQRSELSCTWKLLGDACFFTAKMPEKHSCLMVPKFILGEENEEGNTIVEKQGLYRLAERCYCKGIALRQENTFLWNDIGACYLQNAIDADEDEHKKKLLDYALAAAYHCTSSDPENSKHWNLLGNVAMNMDNKALAQHAFIKAVSVDHDCAAAWSNLGILYLLMGDLRLANEAFAQGQRSDPNYVNSWIGQALIAETTGNEEAMDLFRHSTQLAQNQQGGVGYAHWVCRTLLDAPPNAHIYAIHNMHAVSVACDAILWYTEKNPNDGCAWNMLGILKERMGLKIGATEAFRNAYRLADREYRDKGRVNYGRMLFKKGMYPEAVAMFKDVQEATFNSGSSLALALFKDKKYQDSYEAYEQALNWLTEEQSHQSDLLVALASMAYMFQGPDAAKTLLFQSIQLKPPSAWGFYATLALGLLHNDQKLARLVLKEMEFLKGQKDCLQHYATLICCVYLIKDEYIKAIREVSKVLHRHPEEASVWLVLATLLIKSKQDKKFTASVRCAQIAMALGQSSMDVTKMLSIVSLGSLLAGEKQQALISAQKAVHCYPNIPDCWAVFASALSANRSLSETRKLDLFKHVEKMNAPDNMVLWARSQIKCN